MLLLYCSRPSNASPALFPESASSKFAPPIDLPELLLLSCSVKLFLSSVPAKIFPISATPEFFPGNYFPEFSTTHKCSAVSAFD
jgi:hypothetical protein